MQHTIPASTPLGFGIMPYGFVIIVIYALVRLTTNVEERFEKCKKTMVIGILVMVIIVIIDNVSVYFLYYPNTMNSLTGFAVSVTLGFIFILIMLIDIGVQWFLLKR